MNLAIFNYERDIAPLSYFAGRICHDLNNIITSTMGAASLLELKLGSTAQLDVQNEMERLHNSLNKYQSLTQRMNEIFFEISEGKLPIDMNLTLNSACEDLLRPINIKALPLPVKANINAPLLANAMKEIIANAIEASRMDDPISVSLKENIVDGKKMIQFQCIDQGKGIKEEYLPELFTPFFSKGKRGNLVGLGLAQAGHVIYQHGANLKVYSEEGNGTTVEFSIAAEETQPA